MPPPVVKSTPSHISRASKALVYLSKSFQFIVVESELSLHHSNLVGCDSSATGPVKFKVVKLGTRKVAEWVKLGHLVRWVDLLKGLEQHRLASFVGADEDCFHRFDIEPPAVPDASILLHPSSL